MDATQYIQLNRNLLTAVIDPEYAEIAFRTLTPDDFAPSYQAIARVVYHRLKEGLPTDSLILRSELDPKDRAVFDAEISLAVDASPIVVREWADLLAREARRLRKERILIRALEAIKTSEDIDGEAVRTAQALIEERPTAGHFIPAEDVGGRVLDKVVVWLANPGVAWGLPTGYQTLDHFLGGLEDGSLYIIAARPGVGKTSLALGIANNVADSGQAVGFFTLEMSDEQLFLRLVCMRGGFNAQAIKRGLVQDGARLRAWTEEERDALYDHANRARRLPLYFNPQASISTTEARASLAEIAMRQNVRLVVFDYINLAGDQAENRNRELGSVTQGLKAMAKELKLPVLALAQLNREIERRQNHIPTLADLRDSGEIEANADSVWFIHRDDYYALETGKPTTGIADIYVAKNRSGPVGMVQLAFDERCTRFADIERTAERRQA